MANVVVKADSATPNLVKIISHEYINQGGGGGGTFSINTATDVDTSNIEDQSILIWNASTSKYELEAFTAIAIDAGVMFE